jgi:UDP-glucose 6-dehydrogenase
VEFDLIFFSKFLQAEIRFGGSCFPKDIKALIQFTEGIIAEKPN